MSSSYTIGRLARDTGVSVETIRYYQRRKLFPEPKRPPGGTRRYSAAHAQRLRFIKRAQRLGFTLTEIIELLSLLAPMSCSKTQQIAATKLRIIEDRIQELRAMRNEFTRLLQACTDNNDDARCPIIEDFLGEPAMASNESSSIAGYCPSE